MKAFKSLLASAAILLCCSMATGAEYKYVPLVQEGAKWEYYSTKYYFRSFDDPMKGVSFPFTISLEGDSVVNGKTYKKCWLKFYDKYMHLTTETDRKLYGGRTRFLIALLREEDKRVYAVYQHDMELFFKNYAFGSGSWIRDGDFFEWMIYDFNNIESVLDMPYSKTHDPAMNLELVKDKDETFEIDGAMRKGIKLDYRYRNVDGNLIQIDERSSDIHIIEGIGVAELSISTDISTNRAFLFLSPQAYPISMDEIGLTGLPKALFYKMTLNGKVMLKSKLCPDFGIDEPQTGVEDVESDTTQSADNSYYNLMGQKVNPDNLTTGIYIHRGQKVQVVR